MVGGVLTDLPWVGVGCGAIPVEGIGGRGIDRLCGGDVE